MKLGIDDKAELGHASQINRREEFPITVRCCIKDIDVLCGYRNQILIMVIEKFDRRLCIWQSKLSFRNKSEWITQLYLGVTALPIFEPILLRPFVFFDLGNFFPHLFRVHFLIHDKRLILVLDFNHHLISCLLL